MDERNELLEKTIVQWVEQAYSNNFTADEVIQIVRVLYDNVYNRYEKQIKELLSKRDEINDLLEVLNNEKKKLMN